MKLMVQAVFLSLFTFSVNASAISVISTQGFQFTPSSSSNAFQISFTSSASPIRIYDYASASLALEILPTSNAGGQLINGEITNFPGPGSTVGLGFIPNLSVPGGEPSTSGDKMLDENVFRIGFDTSDSNSVTVTQFGEQFLFKFSDLLGTPASFTVNDIAQFGMGNVDVEFSPVPIPAAGVMMLSAIAGMFVVGRRGKKQGAKPAELSAV